MAEEATRSGPLAGYQVLELARLPPGQMAGMILVDLGADVLRIEEPATARPGAEVRLRGLDRDHPAYAPNRGKRSMILNLKSEGGLRIFRRLAERADVLLEAYRPGVMDRLGLGYETLAAANPRLVYCSLSGYGQTGPFRELPGHDLNYISLGGMAALTAQPGGRPVVPGALMADFAGGSLHTAFAILAALMARERSGRGQYVDVAMTDGVMLLIALQIARYQVSGALPAPGEDAINGGAPYYNFYEAADGRFLSVGALEPQFWTNLCRALGQEDLIALQYAAGPARERVFERLREVFLQRSRDAWIEYLQDKNTCVAPVLALDELAQHPQLLARQMLLGVPGALSEGGVPLQQIGVSLKLSETAARPGGPPPRPGQHTQAVLEELGTTAEEIRALRLSGAVQP